MKNKFSFKTSEITEAGGLKVSVKAEEKDFPGILSKPNRLREAKAEIAFSVGAGSILMEGNVSVKADLACSRCGKFYEGEFGEEFEEIYEPIPEIIDATDQIRDAIAIAEPMKPLCAKNCEGLKNPLEKPEKGPEPKTPNPFGILKEVRFKNEKKP